MKAVFIQEDEMVGVKDRPEVDQTEPNSALLFTTFGTVFQLQVCETFKSCYTKCFEKLPLLKLLS